MIDRFVVTDPEVQAAVAAHDLGFPREHTDLQAASCACRRQNAHLPPGMDVCSSCGGLMIPTGSCSACNTCGASGGCS